MRLPLRYGAQVLSLTVLWVALYDDISVANVVGGLLVAIVVVLIVAPGDEGEVPIAHVSPLPAVGFLVLLIWKLLESNLRLAWEILTPHPRAHTGIFAVPIRVHSNLVIAIVANAITLTPGTLTVEVSRDGEDVTLYVHGMFTSDLESVRRDVLRLDALALRAFGSPTEAEHAADGLRAHDAAVRERAGGEDEDR